MKKDPTSAPFNYEAIPHWLEPDLCDETKAIRFRFLKFIALYTLSVLANALIIYIPIVIYKCLGGLGGLGGLSGLKSLMLWWIILSTFGGVFIGMGGYMDFKRKSS